MQTAYTQALRPSDTPTLRHSGVGIDRAVVVSGWRLRTARGKGLVTETLIAIPASGYGADVTQRVYGTRGDVLHAGMSLATPWEGPMAVRAAAR